MAQALKDADIPHYAAVGLRYERENGTFRRVQQGKSYTLKGFGASGFQSLGKWQFYGEFSYLKLGRDSVQFSNVARPYSGNPFITADSIGGNWRGDQLKAKLAIAYPNYHHWRHGTQITYLTEQANRRNDPRPLYRYLDLALSQDIGYVFNTTSKLSAQLTFTRTTETVETGAFNTSNYKLYSLRGYGLFDFVPVVSAERYTHGFGLQGHLNYSNRTSERLFLVGMKYNYSTQDVEDGYLRDALTGLVKPLLVGGYDRQDVELYMGYLRNTSQRKGWSINANGGIQQGLGYDPRLNGTNPENYFAHVDAALSFWKLSRGGGLLKFTYISQLSHINLYEAISKTDLRVTQLHNDVGLLLKRNLSPKIGLVFEPLLGYHFPLSSDLLIGRPTSITTLLVRPDFDYLQQAYLKAQMLISASLRSDRFEYKLSTGYTSLNPFNGQQRSLLNLRIELIF
jgi:hypothetical protein